MAAKRVQILENVHVSTTNRQEFFKAKDIVSSLRSNPRDLACHYYLMLAARA